MRPVCLLTINGQPVSEAFWSRLISVTVTDKEGVTSDTIDIDLEAGPPFLAIPQKGAIITCAMGYVGAVEHMGTFEADETTLHCYPYHLTIQGKSVDIRGKAKEHRTKHWDNTTFGSVVQELAGEAGLSAQVAPRIAAFKGRDGYFAQESESGLHYIERMSRRLGGLFAIKEGRVIIADKGLGQTPGGAAMGQLIITPEMHLKGSMSVKFSNRESHSRVRAPYYDDKEAKLKHAEAPADPQGEADYTLRHRFTNEDEAKEAAHAKAKELGRSADSTSVEIEGNTSARGGGPMTYRGFHPDVDGLPWIIETAAHRYAKSAGYTTRVDANAPGTGSSAGA